MNGTTRVVIAGAGIGGLTAALALHAQGIEVQVYERVREVAPLGVGINVLPHAMAVLRDLGVVEQLLPLGVETAELCFSNRHGQLIWREPRGIAAGYDVPQLSVHRGHLQLALLGLVRERLGEGAVRTGCGVASFAPTDSGVRVTLHDRVAEGTFVDDAAALVGADGIHSTVRAAFQPHEGPPSWSGNVLWRATSRVAPFLSGRSMVMAGHRPHKFVAYPITPPGDDGLQVVNWIAELERLHDPLPERESWNRRGSVEEFLPWFEDWVFDWLDVPALIHAADDVYVFPMVDRDPLDRWTHGRVTLLGDAAHPMYPIGSNGASQAILDARALAHAVATEGVEAGLVAYEAERRPATARIVESNRRHGPEVVMDLAEERAPGGFADVADVFAAGELEGISAQYKQVAGFRAPH